MRIVKSPRYEKWASSLRDRNVIARINARILQIRHYGALTGDWKAVGDGVFELSSTLELAIASISPLKVQTFSCCSSEAQNLLRQGILSLPRRSTSHGGVTMNSEWTEWDPSLDVNSSEDVAAFLNAVLELGDPAILPDALGVIARSRGMKAIAEETGLGRESLYKSLSKSGNPRFSTVVNVLDCLGFRLQVVPAA